MKEFITGGELKQMFISAAACVDLNKQKINDLNVFPVPDGDTGTNMALTLGNAAKELKNAPDDLTVARCSEIAAAALLRGARGNSGVITSLLFRGFSKYMKEKETADGADFAAALSRGVKAAYKAVMKPAEGTILTVSRVCAETATEACAETTDLETVLEVAVVSAKAALEETVNQNPVLKKAGVVDAGGMGFVHILEAMRSAMLGQPIVAAAEPETAPEVKEQATFSDFAEEDITFSYCTEFIVSRQNDRDPELLREFLGNMGDSLVLVDDDEIIKVHVHTDNPGTAIQEGLKYGQLVTVKVENMRLQHTEKVMNESEMAAAEERKIVPPEKRYGVVTVCAGEGIAAMFRDLGVDQIVFGGQTMNPSTEDILRMIDATPAEVVLVLPNNKNIVMAAEQCRRLSDKQVVVIPTATVPQGITAMLNLDPALEVQENVDNMTEAIQGVTTMQVTYAARNSDFDGYEISAGDYLALCGGALFGTDQDILALLQSLAEKAAEQNAEFVTIFYGENTTEEDAQRAGDIFSAVCPQAEVTVLSGGQPVYYYLISVE